MFLDGWRRPECSEIPCTHEENKLHMERPSQIAYLNPGGKNTVQWWWQLLKMQIYVGKLNMDTFLPSLATDVGMGLTL